MMDVNSSGRPDLYGHLRSFFLPEVGHGLPDLSPDGAGPVAALSLPSASSLRNTTATR